MGFFSGILGNAFGSVASSIGGSLLDKVVGGSDSGGGALGSVANIAGPLVGGILSNKSQSEANDLNYQLAQTQLQFQQEYAKNRLQWQVEDAKKAGLHPMVAAGLSPTSFSPVSAGQSGLNYDWVGEIGQNLDYAATKAKTTRQQAQAFAFTKASNELTLESLKLDNDIKRMQIMSMASRLSNSGPAAPSSGKSGAVVDGQGDSVSPFMDKPIVRDGWLLDEQGRKIGIIPSEDLANRTEDKFVIEWLPWGGSTIRSARAKYFGQKVAGHWWHGDDKGFLPYPPKNTKLKGKGSFYENARNVMRFYRDYDSND